MNEFSLDEILEKGTIFDYVLNGITEGVYIVDKNRRIIFWNKGAEDITGYKINEVLGYRCSEDILNHFDENGIPLCKLGCPLLRTLKHGEVVKMKIYPLLKNGKRIPVMSHISPIKDGTGNIIAAVEVFRDISKEEEFRILQEKYNNLISTYVSNATVERVKDLVLNGKELKSRKSDLTIMVVDVVRFSDYSEKHSPEESAKLLNEFFSICEVITKENFGDIDKFIGDAVMAVFVDANDAVNAAGKLLFALEEMNERRKREMTDTIDVRIAINSGNVIQADIGPAERKELTVIGSVVNTAYNIEKMVPPNSITITEATLTRLRNTDHFNFYNKFNVKGKKEPISLFTYVPLKTFSKVKKEFQLVK